MNLSSIIFAVVLTASLASVLWAHETDQSPNTTKTEPVPVVLSAQVVEPQSKTKGVVDIQLEVGKDYEIYTERKHEYLLPLQAELLDSKRRPISVKIRYPKSVAVQSESALDEFFVYRGKVKLVATFPIDRKPTFVRVFYHGSYKQSR